jgi:signal transduction histidine kinase
MTHGRRTLRLTATQQAADSVLVGVTDTGPGITKELREKLFEPLYTTKPNGMGLGLSISRKIARALGGELSVDSDQEVGAKFVLTLPVAKPTESGTTDLQKPEHTEHQARQGGRSPLV